ncbi:MAG: ATP-binding protein [Caulobacteraceae bacterium]|nr:ATP-binding protein [Caulobacteraceae bacterium]
MSGFKRATKAAAKLRLGLIGPAGSGKTYTALRIAHGLGGRIAVVDTERGSASLYAGERGIDFDVIELDTYEVERFIDAIKDAAAGGYSTIIIDSLSHAWAGKGGILEFVDKAGKRNTGGGNFGAWRDATPRHNALVDAILGAPLHVICTLRSKVEYVVENVGGRNQVRKVGLQPVQRDGLEYEFTVVGDVTQEHDLLVTKTRAAFLKDAVIREAGEELGQQLAAWLADGEVATPADATPSVARAQRPVDAEKPLVEVIRESIDTAKSDRTLRRIIRRLDELVAEDQVTGDQYSELTHAANARLASLTGEVASA